MFSHITKNKIRDVMGPKGSLGMWMASSIVFTFVVVGAVLLIATHNLTNG